MFQDMFQEISPDRIILAAALLVGGYLLRLLYDSWRKRSARREAESILGSAQSEAERTVKEANLASREEMYKLREAFEKETGETKEDLKNSERRLSRREDNLEKKLDLIGKKEHFLEKREAELADLHKKSEEEGQRLYQLIEKEKKALHNISGLSKEEARELLLERIKDEVDHEVAQKIQTATERLKEEVDRKAKHLLTAAIQRCASEHTAETTVGSVELPSDEMKGRIIGREGRNIRAFEKLTGADVIVDDTPGVVIISCFESVKREIAKRAMAKLVVDGRIHPTRIEEVVQSTAKEVDQAIEEAGKQTVLDMGLHGLHPKLVTQLGRLRYRTSYGQNVLEHSMETAHLMASIAAELGMDVTLAKRCGVLHDLGKGLDQEAEGSHAKTGADLARRCGESVLVVNAIAAHHEEEEPLSIYPVLVQAADAVSGARPGARRETLEKYIERLEKLEGIANSFGGVERSFAIQAGREIRVIVQSDKVDDAMSAKMCWDIARQIERELSYPGEVKVTLLRETRVEEIAHRTTGKGWAEKKRQDTDKQKEKE